MNGKTKGILSIPIAAPGFSGMSVCVHPAPDLYSVIGYVLICGAGIGMFFFNKSQKTSAQRPPQARRKNGIIHHKI